MITTTPVMHSRRDVLGIAGVAAVSLAVPVPARGDVLPALALSGPPAGPSITLAHGVAAGLFKDLAASVTFKAWRNPDEMRAGLTSGTMPLVIMPTVTAANLYNRGLGVRLVNVMTNGLLFVVSTDPSLTSFPGLKGRRLAVPFRNDTPEYVANRLIRAHGLTPGSDINVDTTGTPIEAIQMLLAGRVDAALVPEPAASAAIIRAAQAGKQVHRVMDVQAEWSKAANVAPVIPQAGLAVLDPFLKAHRVLVDTLHGRIVQATAEVTADPATAAKHAAPALDLPPPVIQQSIPVSKLVAIRAREARPALETLYNLIAGNNPDLIGGKLPDDGFYL
jgi:NitT/TauT family transport system substrate-binding protein